MAPTGRSAKVLAGYTGESAKTIHKQIYRQKSLKDGIGQFQIDFNKAKETFYIVDEASLITSGGIKSDRILIFFKSLPVQLKKVLHPKAVLHVRLGDSLISHTMVADITMYMLIYMLILFVCALLLCIMGVDFMDSFTSSIASIGNVGPGFGNVGSYGNFSSIPAMGRVVVSVEMLLGRLEIYSLIIVLLISKWK